MAAGSARTEWKAESMSGDVGAPAEAAASTADVAANVIDSFESVESTPVEVSDAPASESVEAAPVESTPETSAEVAKPELSPAAKFLEANGHKALKVDGRPNWLPIKTVEGMLGRFVEQQQSSWHEARTTLESERNTLKADLDELYSDVRGEPKAFLEKLAGADPRYRAFLEPQATPAPPSVPLAAMPDPDVQLPDGSRTYSIDGLKKLLEWNTSAVEARLLPKVDERLKPWQERDKQEQAAKAAEQATHAVRERTQKLIAEAQDWPGFKEHHNDILAALREDSAKAKAENRRPTLTLEGAYRQAVMPKMSADRNKMREELLKEINSSAASTPTVPRTGGGTPKPAIVETRDIAARVMARLENGG
jgi:hypothetical protein